MEAPADSVCLTAAGHGGWLTGLWSVCHCQSVSSAPASHAMRPCVRLCYTVCRGDTFSRPHGFNNSRHRSTFNVLTPAHACNLAKKKKKRQQFMVGDNVWRRSVMDGWGAAISFFWNDFLKLQLPTVLPVRVTSSQRQRFHFPQRRTCWHRRRRQVRSIFFFFFFIWHLAAAAQQQRRWTLDCHIFNFSLIYFKSGMQLINLFFNCLLIGLINRLTINWKLAIFPLNENHSI